MNNKFFFRVVVPTIFIQNESGVLDALNGSCDSCGAKLSDHYESDQLGCVEMFGSYDENDDLVGILCPECYGGICDDDE